MLRKLTITELQQLYNKKSNKEVCRELGISVPTLLALVKKHGIKNKGKGNRQSRVKFQII